MWLITKHGFLSIKAHNQQPDMLVVRARIKGDICRHFPKAKVLLTPRNDYPRRAFLPKEVVGSRLHQLVTEIDYTSGFKDSVVDKRRLPHYLNVWSALAEMQDNLKA
jgi:hypothetical protein